MIWGELSYSEWDRQLSWFPRTPLWHCLLQLQSGCRCLAAGNTRRRIFSPSVALCSRQLCVLGGTSHSVSACIQRRGRQASLQWRVATRSTGFKPVAVPSGLHPKNYKGCSLNGLLEVVPFRRGRVMWCVARAFTKDLTNSSTFPG